MADPADIETQILQLTGARGSDRSICPSEVARAMCGEEGGWRALMPDIRAAAIRLADRGRIDILRKGRPVAPSGVRGVIRLRRRSGQAGT